MPTLNRRRFLKMASAAGLIPALPALPASSAVAPVSATNAQLLWASLFSQAGNAKTATGLASAMGISNTAAQGIHAKLVQNQVLAGTSGLGHFARPRSAGLRSPTGKADRARSIRANIEEWLSDDVDETRVNDEEAINKDAIEDAKGSETSEDQV